MHVRTHALDVVVHQLRLVLQFVYLIEAGIVCNANAVQTVELMVCSNSFRRRGDLWVINESFAFRYKPFPCFLRVDGWTSDEGMILMPYSRSIT